MDLATGAMGSLLPKLAELLSEEYKLQKGVREGVKSLEKEMRSMHAALRVVGEVPRDQLDELVKLWAEEVRELSFDMEDIVDKFLVRVDDDSEPAKKSNKLKRAMKKMAGLFTKGKDRHEIADAIKDINKQVQEAADRRQRYNVDNIMHAAVTPIDPRLKALYTEVTELVGISGKRDQELMLLLSNGDSMSKNKLKMVSVVGFGGLGKTTLVKTVYDKIKGDFDYKAFVPVGRNADAKKVFMDILVDLGTYIGELTGLDERQLIDKLRKRLENQRKQKEEKEGFRGNLKRQTVLKLWELYQHETVPSHGPGRTMYASGENPSLSLQSIKLKDDRTYLRFASSVKKCRSYVTIPGLVSVIVHFVHQKKSWCFDRSSLGIA